MILLVCCRTATNAGDISGVYLNNSFYAYIATNMGNHRDIGVAWYEPVDLDGDSDAEGVFVSKEVYP